MRYELTDCEWAVIKPFLPIECWHRAGQGWDWVTRGSMLSATSSWCSSRLFSFYQRYRYGTSTVVPLGLILSLVAVCIMLFTDWKGGEMVFRHRVAVYDEPGP